jgi:hypothetical protein
MNTSHNNILKTPAYWAGYEAYREQGGSGPFEEGQTTPYSPNNSDYWDWLRGWNDRGIEDAADSQYQDSYWE